jgi:hypothetical protein
LNVRGNCGLAVRPSVTVGCASPSPLAGHRSPVAGRRSPVAGRRSPVAERRTPNAERRTPNAERRRIGKDDDPMIPDAKSTSL